MYFVLVEFQCDNSASVPSRIPTRAPVKLGISLSTPLLSLDLIVINDMAPASGHSNLILRRQLQELTKHPVEGFSAGLVDDNNLLEWEVLIIGPENTLYEGGFLKARLSFPPEYPLLPPKMRFVTPMWHPSVYPDGAVCISILHAPGEDQWGYEDASERWLPVHTVETILISVISLLSADTPNTESPANIDAAKQVRTDLPEYRKKVRRLVRQSAEDAYD